MTKSIKLIIGALFAIMLCSCAPSETLLIVLDPYTKEIFSRQGVGEGKIERRYAELGFRVVLEVSQPEEMNASSLTETIQRTRASHIYISPIFSLDMEKLLARFPEKIFILERSPALEAHGNLVRLEFDQEEAFYEAGRRTGLLLRKGSLSIDFPSEPGRARAGILISVPIEAAKLEAAAFREGFLSVASGEPPITREIGNLTDEIKAKRMLEKMREDGVAVVLLKTYTLTSICLEALEELGGLAIVEGWLPADTYQDVVLMSIKEDLLGGLEEALRRVQGIEPATGVGNTVVKGPVELVMIKELKEHDIEP